ncbi:MAG TPA: FAD-dependent oxidoreductase [bacterium]|nr:FAD-dependent oxidoreductase [bacterium]
MYETIIVGGGPAGITAGIYLARKKVSFALITMDIGGQTLGSGGIENYIGHQYITGPELAEKFALHLKEFNIDLKEGHEVKEIKKDGSAFVVRSDKGQYRAKTVIVCTGRKPKNLDVPGEKEFYNRGITYCATCDGPLFAGKKVAVVGGGNSGLEVALQMVRIAEKVYVIELKENLTGDRILADKLNEAGNLEIITSAAVARIHGDKFVSGVSLRKSEKQLDIQVEGVLVEIGSIPNSHVVEGIEKNGFGEIIINCGTETSIPGLFAAGDVTNVFKKQIIIACGEGAKSAIAASEYLYFKG